MIRPLTLSSLYPSAGRPQFGVFVENRLRHLAADGGVVPRVVAPLPWSPPLPRAWDPYAKERSVPAREKRHGIEIDHPRYPHLPKLGVPMQPWLLYRRLARWLKAELAAGRRYDLIDAHYVYPDGVAAALLARRFELPLVITARGTDLSLIALEPLPRRWIRWAIGRANGLVGVCNALAEVYVELGADPARVHTFRNGVDLQVFRPVDREAARRELGLTGPTLLAVGQLIERKGVHLILEAMAQLPGTTLLLAGDGPDRTALAAQAARLGLTSRVRFLGNVAHERLPQLYTAADCMVLASSREGWANVLLESMACGTAVAATAIWGTPEVVTRPEAGRLIPERSAASIAATIAALLADPPDRAATRAYAEGFGWEPTSRGQCQLFAKVIAEGPRA